MSTSTALRFSPSAAIVWQWARLSDLAVTDLYAVMAARQLVFAVEQRCAYLDADGFDTCGWHLLGWKGPGPHPELAAYLRVIEPGHKFVEPSIGRVLTSAAHRRRTRLTTAAKSMAAHAGGAL